MVKRSRKPHAKRSTTGRKTYFLNRRARHDYQIVAQLEAGLVLSGMEVKAVKTQGINLDQALVQMSPEGAFLAGANIPRYRFATDRPYDPQAKRQLLLHRRELKLLQEARQKKLALVPLSCYQKRGWLKIKIGIGRRRTKFAKKQRLIEREIKRRLAGTVKQPPR